MKRKGLWIGLTIAVIAVAVIGFVVYRYTAPVRVEIVGVADGVPFTIETIPASVTARPGEMVKVTYRISNERYRRWRRMARSRLSRRGPPIRCGFF